MSVSLEFDPYATPSECGAAGCYVKPSVKVTVDLPGYGRRVTDYRCRPHAEQVIRTGQL